MSVSDTSMTQLTQRQTDRRVTCLPLTRMAVIDGARLSTTFVSRLEQNRTTALPHTDTHTRGLRHWSDGYLLSMCLPCGLTWTTTDVTQPDTWHTWNVISLRVLSSKSMTASWHRDRQADLLDKTGIHRQIYSWWPQHSSVMSYQHRYCIYSHIRCSHV